MKYIQFKTLIPLLIMVALSACAYPGMDRRQAPLGQDARKIAEQQTLNPQSADSNAGVIYTSSGETRARIVREVNQPAVKPQAPVTINIGQ